MVLGIRQRAAVGRRGTVVRPPLGTPARREAPAVSKPRRLCPELDCVRGWLHPTTIAAAERRALTTGVGADRVLVTGGLLDDDIYVRLLADALGIGFEPLDAASDTDLLDEKELLQAPSAGLLRLKLAGDVRLVVTPQGDRSRRLTALVRSNPALAKRFRLTTAARLQAFVVRHGAAAIGDYAVSTLPRRWPAMAAGPPRQGLPAGLALLACAGGFGALLAAPPAVKLGCGVLLTAIFLAWIALRSACALTPRRGIRHERLPDRALPVYTVLAPLYREVAALPGLIPALRRLDYPPEKLDIKLIVEPDDLETRAALAQLDLAPPFEVIIAPQAGPRTKPKALNAALPFARGAFTVIYDAEDRPEPQQLREALAAFLTHDDGVACVQASLTIDNTADNWLTTMFTAEYAGQFDVFLPGLAQLELPLPLGGSSNHFRTATLRAVGGWDAYNVTEDADLGVRLARFGYRSVAIAATTYEEAPGRFGAWLRQRTRWFKGWMQTWLVHIRAPRRLVRELGVGGFLAVQLVVGGSVLASLVHPLLIVSVLMSFTIGSPVWTGALTAALFGTTIFSGYVISVLLGAIGLSRRGLMPYAWVLLLMPLHWLLLSLAAWRALYQLLHSPYGWEKTEHGLARTSRVVHRSRPRHSSPVNRQ
jgi:cellulose synthase/poly-beta-1,6-N-acetylglucosamine synthase-like glycosyltransferase